MSRPRGFIEDWKPQASTEMLVGYVEEIINESDILPLTLRQIFYMLVSGYGYDKTEKAYKRLCETLNKARRARVISMSDIRDDGLTRQSEWGWRNGGHYLRSIKAQAEYFELDHQMNQDVKVYVWCEAGGMVPQLADALTQYHIPVISSGGFDSVTTKHNFAEEISEHSEVVILHLGDHDPSGVHMFGSLDEDLQAFLDYYGGSVNMQRIAVTPDQVEELGLPTAPPKTTDRRSFVGQTTQCEAIHPSELRRILIEHVMPHIDQEIYDKTIEEEEEIRAELVKKLDGII